MVKIGLFTPGWASNLAFNDTVPFNVVLAPAPTATPTPTATPSVNPIANATAKLSKASVVKGQSITITSSVKAGSKATKLLVDTEVYCSSDNVNWTKDYQNFRDNQSYTAAQTRNYSDKWTVPADHAAATCVVKVGLFTPGWASLVAFFDAATFTIQ
jgi:hypothetical protein